MDQIARRERLQRELRLLDASKAEFNVSCNATKKQLIDDFVLADGPAPAMPQWQQFNWPRNGIAIPDGPRYTDNAK